MTTHSSGVHDPDPFEPLQVFCHEKSLIFFAETEVNRLREPSLTFHPEFPQLGTTSLTSGDPSECHSTLFYTPCSRFHQITCMAMGDLKFYRKPLFIVIL